jgi:hypothetical protein
MKRWIMRGAVAAALIAGGWGVWYFLFPSPERVIRGRVQELARLASFSSNEGALAAAYRSEQLAAFFARDVVLVLNVPGDSVRTWTGRDTVQEIAMRARTALHDLHVKFPDVAVSLSPGRQGAVVNVTAEVRYSGHKTPDVQELRLRFEKIGGDWLIKRVETVRTLLWREDGAGVSPASFSAISPPITAARARACPQGVAEGIKRSVDGWIVDDGWIRT